MMGPDFGIAVRILADRREHQRVARIARAAQNKVQVSLRIPVEVAEILDCAAANRGMTIDEFVERLAREVANG